MKHVCDWLNILQLLIVRRTQLLAAVHGMVATAFVLCPALCSSFFHSVTSNMKSALYSIPVLSEICVPVA